MDFAQYSAKPLGICQEYFDLIVSWCNEAWLFLRPDQPNYYHELFKTRLSETDLPIAYVIFKKDNPNVRLVGTFSLTSNMLGIGNPDLIMLNNLYVAKEFRGQGIGKDIIRIAENIANGQFDLDVLQLATTDLELKSFYENLGWKITDRTSFDSHEVLVFVKQLNE